MNAANRQIQQACDIARRKGLIIVGYRPATGLPTHPDGSPILVIETAKPRASEPAADVAKASKSKPRGIAVETQGALF